MPVATLAAFLVAAVQTGAAQGMNLLDSSLAQLVKAGTVKREDALIHAEDAKLIPGAAAAG